MDELVVELTDDPNEPIPEQEIDGDNDCACG